MTDFAKRRAALEGELSAAERAHTETVLALEGGDATADVAASRAAVALVHDRISALATLEARAAVEAQRAEAEAEAARRAEALRRIDTLVAERHAAAQAAEAALTALGEAMTAYKTAGNRIFAVASPYTRGKRAEYLADLRQILETGQEPALISGLLYISTGYDLSAVSGHHSGFVARDQGLAEWVEMRCDQARSMARRFIEGED